MAIVNENVPPGTGTEPVLVLNPRRSALLDGHANTLEVLARVQGPARPAGQAPTRAPFNVAFVLDRSGSMRGQPLAEACRCAQAMIQRLTARDRAALVVFDDQVQVLVASQPVADQRPFQAALATVHSGGQTNLHGGWVQGADEVAGQLRPEQLNRIVLLSDGNANAGLCALPDLFGQCAELANTGVTTSTYGLGNDFNEELMVGMAQAGLGNAYYSDTADDLLAKFQEEFALLQDLCARQLRLRVRPAPGVQVQVLNDYPALGEGGWRLPDLAYDGEVWALLRVQVSAQAMATAVAEPLSVLDVELAWTDLAGQERRRTTAPLALPALPAAAFGAVAEDEAVVARLTEIHSANLKLEAWRAVRQGDWATVDAVLAQIRQLAQAHPWLAAIVTELENLAKARDKQRFGKEAYYSSSRMRRRLTSKDEAAQDLDDGEKPAYWQRQSRQGKSGSS